MDQAVRDGRALAKAAALQPSLSTILERFGPAGFSGDPRGKWTYKFPRGSEALERRVKDELTEMTEPARRVSVALSGETNARILTTRLREPSGRVREVPIALEDHIGRKLHAVPVVRVRGLTVEPDADGYLWRKVGDRWEPLGHNHFGRPWAWQKAACRGCA